MPLRPLKIDEVHFDLEERNWLFQRRFTAQMDHTYIDKRLDGSFMAEAVPQIQESNWPTFCRVPPDEQ